MTFHITQENFDLASVLLKVCTETDLTRDLHYTFTHSLTHTKNLLRGSDWNVCWLSEGLYLSPPLLPQLSVVLIVLRAFTLWFLIIILTTHCSSDSNLITTFVCALPHLKVLQNTFSFSREAPSSPQYIYRQCNHSVVCQEHRDFFLRESTMNNVYVSSHIFHKFQQFLQTHCKMKQFCP